MCLKWTRPFPNARALGTKLSFQTPRYSLRSIIAHYIRNICGNIGYIVGTDAVDGVFRCLN